MDIYEEAYNLGISLRYSDKGRDIYDKYCNISSFISEKSFNELHDVGQRLMHYYLFPSSLDRLRANRDNKKIPDFMRNEILKIINTPELDLFCKGCELFGKRLEEASKYFFGHEIPKKFTEDIGEPEVVRAMINLNAACTRSGLVQKLIQYNKRISNFKEILRDYERERQVVRGAPFDKNVRKLIKKLKNNYDLSILYFCEFFISVLTLIKEIIFEAHLDLISEINREDLISFKMLGNNQIKLFKLELPNKAIRIFNQKGIISSINNDREKIFLLIEKRIFNFSKETGTKLIWSGLICPTKIM